MVAYLGHTYIRLARPRSAARRIPPERRSQCQRPCLVCIFGATRRLKSSVSLRSRETVAISLDLFASHQPHLRMRPVQSIWHST